MPRHLLLSSWLKGAGLFEGSVYSRAAFIISARSYSIKFYFCVPAMAHGAGGGSCGGAGSVRKGIAAAAHNTKREILYLLDETFIILALSI